MAILPIAEIKARFETGDYPNGQDYANLIDTLASQSTVLGTAGNNEGSMTGITQGTVMDSILISEWRLVKYVVSILYSQTGVNKSYSTQIFAQMNADGIDFSEYGTLDNDGDVGTVSVSNNGAGSLELLVVPNPSLTPVTVRWNRTGLKA
jgi:hypothetical protein